MHHQITYFSPLGARLRAAERAYARPVRIALEVIACALVGAALAALFLC